MRTRKSFGNSNIIGRNITAIRKAQGIRQCELLARLQLIDIGFTDRQLSFIEGGQRGVKDYEIVALSKALNVPIQKLFEGDVRST